MNIFLSCVSGEFRSYRLKLANQLGALKNHPCEIKVQEDFQQGGFTLLDQLADYIRSCDLVIHLVGRLPGARPTQEHVRAMFERLCLPLPSPLPERSYTQWEYDLARMFDRRVLVFLAAAEAPLDCGPEPLQDEGDVRLQQEHRATLERCGEHYETFSSHTDLVRRVFYDLGLQDGYKINNLPYKTLGSLFKGREDFLRKLRDRLGTAEHRGHQRVAAITAAATAATVHGLGGVGKTRAAIEFAHRYSEEYTALLFVQADSPQSLQQNLAGLCGSKVLDLAEKDTKEIEVQVEASLRWLKQHPGWFLILDNVDTEEAARGVEEMLSRLSDAGQVLITSRLSNWPGAVESLSLDVLAEQEAADFLLERTAGRRRPLADDAELAKSLAIELGQLALALEQAGAYIARYRSSFAGYQREWQQRHDRTIAWFDERTMQYPRSVAVTWQTSFDRLSEPAQRLLRMLCWLAPDPIPESLLEAGGGPFANEKVSYAQTCQEIPGLLFVPVTSSMRDSGAEDDARDALAELESYSLLKRSDEWPSFDVHRLVQDVTRRNLTETESRSYVEAALRWMNNAFVGNPQDVRNWPVLERLAPHVKTLTTFADARDINEPTARLMNQLATLLCAKIRFTEAEPLIRRALAIGEASYGSDNPKVATTLNNLAALMSASNRFAEAELLYRRALAINEASFGPNSAEVATTLNNLAMLAKETNHLTEAELLYRRALAINEASFGPNSAEVATILNNLAKLLKDTNRRAKAGPMIRRALEIDEASYGPNHPKVAIDLKNLAELLKDTNHWAEAEPMIRRALAITEASYGPNHPQNTDNLNVLAELLKNTDRWSEAEPLLRRALTIDEANYGPEHSNVAADLCNLSGVLCRTNRLTEAEPMIRRALEIDEARFGSGHPKVAIDLSNLAELLKETNRLAEAEPMIRRALAIVETSYGPHHPDLAYTLTNLAGLLYETDRLADAEPLLRRALSIVEASYGPDHPEVASRLHNLIALLLAAERLAEAEPLYRRVLAIFAKFERTSGHKHPQLDRSLRNYKRVLSAMDVAEDEIERRVGSALRGQDTTDAKLGCADGRRPTPTNQETIPETHRNLEGVTLENKEQERVRSEFGKKALILKDQGDLDGAMACYKEVERICRELGNKDGLHRALNNQVLILKDRGDMEAAMTLLKECECLCRELEDKDGLQVILGNQANILCARGDMNGASTLQEEAVGICRELGNKDGLQRTLGNQALICMARGNMVDAMALLKESELICRELGNMDGLQRALGNQVSILCGSGDLEGAMALLKEQECICRDVDIPEGLSLSLANQANLLSRNPITRSASRELADEALAIAIHHGYQLLIPQFKRIRDSIRTD